MARARADGGHSMPRGETCELFVAADKEGIAAADREPAQTQFVRSDKGRLERGVGADLQHLQFETKLFAAADISFVALSAITELFGLTSSATARA